MSYKCSLCGKKVSNKEKRKDHIDPVIDPQVGFPLLPNGEDNWNVYIKRLFCDISNIQVICKTCHDQKTQIEREIRKQARKKLSKKKQ